MIKARLLLVCVALTVLAGGCGFEPLYANRGRPGNSAQSDLNATKIATIADRSGQMLRNELVDRMNVAGEPARPAYELKIKLRENEEKLLVRKDEVATAANLTLYADFQLTEIGSGKVLTSGTARSVARYDVLRSQYGTIAAEQDARARVIRQIAEDIRTRVGIYFNAARGH